jgi:hypothetical protein
MNTNPPAAAKIPHAIATYQAARFEDVPTALAQFADDARVVDDGKIYDGLAGVESFLRTAGSEYTYTTTLLSAVEVAPDHWLVTNHLEGNFPGSHVDLTYDFRLANGLIEFLAIAP